MRNYLLLLFWFFDFNQILSAQSLSHPSFRQITTDNGLSSSEVYQILQYKTGFIWICTDYGINCFDGYGFNNYGIKDGLKENVIFAMQLYLICRIWMQAMSGNLYHMEKDSIHDVQKKQLQHLVKRTEYK